MEQPKKILVPIDLSDRSEIAVKYGAMLARPLGAELAVMTNIDIAERARLQDFAASEDITVEDAAHAAIHRAIVTHAAGLSTSTVLTSRSDAAEGILDAVSVEAVDLIVLASHGRSGMTRWLLGSVAEKIVRTATVPVTIVPARDSS